MENSITEKVCSKCKEVKPISEFNIRKEGKSRHRNDCKICQYKVNAEYRKANKEKVASKMKEWYVKNKERMHKYHKEYRENNKKERNAACKKWSLDNKEYLREYHKKYYEEHRDHKKEIVKKYRKENPDKVQVARYIRNERVRNNGGSVTAKEWIEIKKLYGNKCLCCGKTNIPLHIDHVIPLSLGGRNSIENLQPLCKSCNSRKNAKTIDYRP